MREKQRWEWGGQWQRDFCRSMDMGKQERQKSSTAENRYPSDNRSSISGQLRTGNQACRKRANRCSVGPSEFFSSDHEQKQCRLALSNGNGVYFMAQTPTTATSHTYLSFAKKPLEETTVAVHALSQTDLTFGSTHHTGPTRKLIPTCHVTSSIQNRSQLPP